MKNTSSDAISVSGAISEILRGSGLLYGKFPQVDLIVVLDVLSVLARHGKLAPKQLSNSLNSRPDRHTLRKYLNCLLELGLVSVNATSYRGVARSKHFIEITLKGRSFLSKATELLETSH